MPLFLEFLCHFGDIREGLSYLQALVSNTALTSLSTVSVPLLYVFSLVSGFHVSTFLPVLSDDEVRS